MNHHKPLSKRKTVQLLVALTLLAWATQTLFHQWAHGQEVQPFIVTPDLADGDQKFIRPDSSVPNGTLELKTEATVAGAEVKLKQVCRWSSADATIFNAISDMTLAHLSDTTPYRSLSVEEIRRTLHDAGVNVALINFSGATVCTVTRNDVQVDERTALNDWINSRDPAAKAPATQPAAAAVQAAMLMTPSETPRAAVPVSDDKKPHTLRELLAIDVCQRLSIDPDLLQITFKPEDEKILELSEPLFTFRLDPTRMSNLGTAQWDVTIVAEGGNRKVMIAARTAAWVNQVIVARPVAFKQMLQDADFTDRRVLTDELPGQPLLTRAQCIGQTASQDLKPGTVMNARLVDPVPLVHAGELVTIMLTKGSVQLRSVARSMETGCFGQSIKVKSETTRDVFDVTVTGPQEARLGGKAPVAGVATAGN